VPEIPSQFTLPAVCPALLLSLCELPRLSLEMVTVQQSEKTCLHRCACSNTCSISILCALKHTQVSQAK